MRNFIASESVTEGHPDKLCDQISDAILDEVIKQDPLGRVAIETLVTNGLCVVAGELTTKGYIEVSKVARGVIRDAGYTKPEYGFDYRTCGMLVSIQGQSPDIAQGIGKAEGEKIDKIGAGDQGMMYGYATDETKELMPLPILLAHKLTKRLAEVRKKKILPYLRPDGKSQVVIEYENGKPARLVNVLISTQHDEGVSQAKIKKDIITHVIWRVVPSKLFKKDTEFFVNPTGKFVIGGPQADTGLTGRKIVVDTYGGVIPNGGGCFSGKDPTKVDRSAAYAARHAAVNLVAASLAKQAEVQLAYAIGIAKPLAVNVNTFGTGKISDRQLGELVRQVFDLRPGMIIKNLNLRRPIYRQVAAYGHFGRPELKLSWEKKDKVRELKRKISLSLVTRH